MKTRTRHPKRTETLRTPATWKKTLLLLLVVLLCCETATLADDRILAGDGLVSCDICTAQARKRVAVMPVNLGELPAHIQAASTSIAGRLRDQIEAELATSPSLIATNRSHLDGVIQEQKLAASGAFASVGAPKIGQLITAQLLLYVNLQRVDVSTRIESSSSDGSEWYVRQAYDLDDESGAMDELARKDRKRTRTFEPVDNPKAQMLDSILDNQFEAQAKFKEERARRLRAKAEQLRRQAALDAEQRVDERQEITARIKMGWTAVDTTTGVTVASGTVTGEATGAREAHSVQSAFASESVIQDSPDSAAINDAIDLAIGRLGVRVDLALANEPFRAKVASVQGDQVVINAGAGLGVRVGDTFGVRRNYNQILDPDTGLPLQIAGDPIGALRVVSVQEKAAFARIVRRTSALKIGDELEWIGLLVASGDIPAARRSAERFSDARRQRQARLRQIDRAEESGDREPTAATSLFDQYADDAVDSALDDLLNR